MASSAAVVALLRMKEYEAYVILHSLIVPNLSVVTFIQSYPREHRDRVELEE